MWQVLRSQLVERGVEIVTVAQDAGGVVEAKPFVDWAGAEHPSLIDESHVMAEMFGVVNVPNSVWIDENGMIVRPAEPAHLHPRTIGPDAVAAAQRDYLSPPGGVSKIGGRGRIEGPDDDSEMWRALLDETSRPHTDARGYTARLLDWIERGAASPHALSAEQVTTVSAERPVEHSEAAAHFALGQHCWREGDEDGAAEHWREAHRLQPENWNYKRQAQTFAAGPMQGPSAQYEGSHLEDLRAAGGIERFYRQLDVPTADDIR